MTINDLPGIMLLSSSDYETLYSTGSLTVGGETFTYDNKVLYLIASATDDELTALLNRITVIENGLVGRKTSQNGEIFSDYSNNTAGFSKSAAFGDHTSTGRIGSFVAGKYNSPDSNALFEVGNGTSESDRKTAMAVKFDGSVSASQSINITGQSSIATTGAILSFNKNTGSFEINFPT